MVARNRRAGTVVEGHREAIALAATLGGTIRQARRARRLSLSELGEREGLSATRVAEIERGEGVGTPLQVWIAIGIALERPLAISLTRPLGESRDGLRDAGHLEIQEFLLARAAKLGRHGTFELPTRPLDPSRSTDVGLRDPHDRLRILAECWNTFGDLGVAVRATTRKAAEAAATWPDDRIATVWVVRATAANRALLARYPNTVDAAFPGSSRAWVAALTSGAEPPDEPGIVWFDARSGAGRLTERRRSTI